MLFLKSTTLPFLISFYLTFFYIPPIPSRLLVVSSVSQPLTHVVFKDRIALELFFFFFKPNDRTTGRPQKTQKGGGEEGGGGAKIRQGGWAGERS